MSKLHISPSLSLPIDFVTSTQAILAKRGVGKSHTASVEAEEMLKAHLPIIAIDPTGAWYGLKSSKDGKSAGYPIAIFGGEHADVPLEDTAGETIATAIVRHRFSAIIDLSLLRKAQWYKFLASFLETLYLLNRQAVHLFVDEAHKLAPQKLMAGAVAESRVLGAMEDIAQMGRRKGIGCTFITQRPAVLNKNLLTQCELLCVMRLIHNLDIDAVKEWIDVHGDKEKAKQLISDLPSLPVGTAWFWSPGMTPEIFAKVHIRERETFDSGATPELGKKVRPPKVLAQVDLQQLGEQIAATVERAKADDPKELKKKIADLQRQLAKPNPSLVQRDSKSADNKRQSQVIKSLKSGIEAAMKIIAAINAKGFDKVGLGKEEIEKALQQASAEIVKLAESQIKRRGAEFDKLKAEAERVLARLQQLANDEEIKVNLDVTHNEPFTLTSRPVSAKPRTNVVQFKGDVELTGPERKILKALGELFSIGKEQAPKNMVAAWSGYSPLGGAFGNPIGALRSKGLIDYPQPGIVVLTDAGRSVVGPCDAPDRDEIWRRIESTCTGPEQKILRALIDNAGQDEIAKEQLAEKAGYSPVGGAFGNPIGALRTKGLLDYPRQGVVKAADWLFAA